MGYLVWSVWAWHGQTIGPIEKKFTCVTCIFFGEKEGKERKTAISFLVPALPQPIHSLFTLPFLIFVPFINKLDKYNNKGRKLHHNNNNNHV